MRKSIQFILSLTIFSYSLLQGQDQSLGGNQNFGSLASASFEDATFDLTFEIPSFSSSAAYMIFESGGNVHGTSISMWNDRIIFYSQSPNNSTANRGAVEITLPPSEVGATITLRATIDRIDPPNTSQTLSMSAYTSNGLTFTGVAADIGFGPENLTHNSQRWSGSNGASLGQNGSGFAGDNLFPAPYATMQALPTGGTITFDRYEDDVLEPIASQLVIENVNTSYQIQTNTYQILDDDIRAESSSADINGDYDGVSFSIGLASAAPSNIDYRIFSGDGVVSGDSQNGQVRYNGNLVGNYTVTNGVLLLTISNAQGNTIGTTEFNVILRSIRILNNSIYLAAFDLTLADGSFSVDESTDICFARLDIIDEIILAAENDDASDVSVNDLYLASTNTNALDAYLSFYQAEIEALVGTDLDTCEEISDLIERVNLFAAALDKINTAHINNDASLITISDLIDASGLDTEEVDPALLSEYQTEIEDLALGAGRYDYLLDRTEVAILVGSVNQDQNNNSLILVETGINADIGSITTGGQDSGISQNDATIDLNFKMRSDFSSNYVLLEYGGTFRGLAIGLRGNVLVLLNLNDSNQMALHEITLTTADLDKQLSLRLRMDQGATQLSTDVYLIGGDGRLVYSPPQTLATTAWTGTDAGALGTVSSNAHAGTRSFNGSVPLPGITTASIYPLDGNDRNLIYQLYPSILLPALEAQPSLENLTSLKSQLVDMWEYLDTDWELNDYSYELHGNFDGASFTLEEINTGTNQDIYQILFTDPDYNISGNQLQYLGETFATFTDGAQRLTLDFDSSALTPEVSGNVLLNGRQILERHINTVLRSIQYQRNAPVGEYTLRANWTTAPGRSTSQDITITVDTAYSYGLDLLHHSDAPSGTGTDTPQNFTASAGSRLVVPLRLENENIQPIGTGEDTYVLTLNGAPDNWSVQFIDDYSSDGIFQNPELPLPGNVVSIAEKSFRYILCKIEIPARTPGDTNDNEISEFADYPLSITATSITEPTATDTIDFGVQIPLITESLFYPDQQKTVAPGSVVEYEHTLENNSELDSDFVFEIIHQVGSWQSTLSDSLGNALPTTVYAGQPMPFVSLNSGEQATLRIRINVPSSVPGGYTQITTIRAIPLAAIPQGNGLELVDVTQVVSGTVRLLKSANTLTQQPGEVITVTTEWKNLGSSSVQDVVIFESISSYVSYIKGSVNVTVPASYTGTVDIENSSDGGISWATESGTGADATITNLRILFDQPFSAGSEGLFEYQAIVK